MFKPFLFQGIEIGVCWTTSSHVVFFGNNKGSLDLLTQAFPHLHFFQLTQIHSPLWVENSNTSPKADAHFTRKTHQALTIRTADCLPIMITAPGFAAAIHAGWRGLAQGVLLGLKEHLPRLDGAGALIGPHIGFCSFEVGQEVVDAFGSFVSNYSLDSALAFGTHPAPGKGYVNLDYLAQGQLRSLGVPEVNSVETDTFVSDTYHSYRRDGSIAGRQISFVARLS
ncbi:MAG: polyphenol oxidase family protein [Bdellovibrionales bacterium]|nr:polyphenol oxidase family protein [Bdellovibrionales bacterium]